MLLRIIDVATSINAGPGSGICAQSVGPALLLRHGQHSHAYWEPPHGAGAGHHYARTAMLISIPAHPALSPDCKCLCHETNSRSRVFSNSPLTQRVKEGGHTELELFACELALVDVLPLVDNFHPYVTSANHPPWCCASFSVSFIRSAIYPEFHTSGLFNGSDKLT